MWQVTYVPRPPTLRYPHQSCHVGWGPGRSQPCQVSSKLVKGFRLPEGSKSAFFLYLVLWLILHQVRATAQPVMSLFRTKLSVGMITGWAVALTCCISHSFKSHIKLHSGRIWVLLPTSNNWLMHRPCSCEFTDSFPPVRYFVWQGPQGTATQVDYEPSGLQLAQLPQDVKFLSHSLNTA